MNYVNIDFDAVGVFAEITTADLRQSREAFPKYATAKTALAAQQQSPQRLNGADHLKADAKLRDDHLAMLPANFPQRQRDLAAASTALDLRNIEADAAYVPVPPADASINTHYQYTMANELARASYERRLSRMTPVELAAEVHRIDRSAGDTPARSAALAQMHALDEYLSTKQGDEYVSAKSDLIEVRKQIGSRWKQYAAATAKLAEAAVAVDEISEIGVSIRTGSPSQRLGYLNWARKQQAA